MVVSQLMLPGFAEKWLRPNLAMAVALYVVTLVGLAIAAPPSLWTEHTPFNHFSWLAASWLEGRTDFAGQPPAYAAGNDFAHLNGRWFVVFPGFPALLLLPWVRLLGGPDHVPDGAIFLWFAPLAPVGLSLALRRLNDAKIAELSQQALLGLPLLYAFGTVFFFTAVQGTVWFAAHVTAAVLSCFFLWASIGAKRPFIAGLLLSALFATRTHLLVYGVFFLFELFRVRREVLSQGRAVDAHTRRQLALLVFPVAVTVLLVSLNNYVRFGSPFEFGYRYLDIAWKGRIERWGLFSYHYLARNLGILLTSLPYVAGDADGLRLQVNGHGLALWVTSPFYLWLLWPRRSTCLSPALYTTLALVAVPSLLYQNSGWLQFGQRFSNDYAPLLMLLLALGGYRMGKGFKLASLLAIFVNAFGASSFGDPSYARYYFVDRSQRILYEPD